MNTVNFGESLSGLLVSRNIRPEDLADKIGVSRSTVYNWKNNEQEPNLDHLLALADCFECSLEFLIGRSDDERKVSSVICPIFSANLRRIMKEKQISTYALRKRSRFNSGYFQKWDAGASPLLSTLVELAGILDCSVDYLVGRE